MDDKEKKEKRVQEVEELITKFCETHLTSEFQVFSLNLWRKLARKPNFPITGGKKEIWAAAIIYIIARLNFLFDKTSENHLTADAIADFFGAKKRTVSNKATEIEKLVDINMGDPDYCQSKINDMFSIVQLPNGMVVPKTVAKEMGLIP